MKPVHGVRGALGLLPRLRSAVLVVCVLAFGHAPQTLAGTGSGPDPDPLERINRAVFEFNDAFDQALLRPVAVGYERHVPELLRWMAANWVTNLRQPYVAVNNLLQGKPLDAGSDLARFGVNLLLGFGGVADPASEFGFPRHQEDVGQTLGVWGVPPGPYLMLPLLGPSTLRDGFGRVLENRIGPYETGDNVSLRNSVRVLDIVQTRVSLLPADRLLADALDRYLMVRDSYLQRRRNLVYDGDPPMDFDED